MNDVEAIERATAAAVAPNHTDVFDGWVIGLAPGEIRRGKSAAPLRHDSDGLGALSAVEARYRTAGLAPIFRIAEVEGLQPLTLDLKRRGYVARNPTIVMAGALADMRAVSREPADITAIPGDGWLDVFTGEGFDRADGESRLAALSRSPSAVYASVTEDGETLAVGVAAMSDAWVSVHGMRTSQAHRGRGLARRVLAGLAARTTSLGHTRVFLQVEEENASARRLYEAAGLSPRWRYVYWQPPEG